MSIAKNELIIPLCEDPYQSNCFLTWRSFDYLFYPKKWKFGDNFLSINPVTFKSDNNWSKKNNHMGI